MDDELKRRIEDYFTASELVDFLAVDHEEGAMSDLVEHLRDLIEENIDDVKEFMNYGNG